MEVATLIVGLIATISSAGAMMIAFHAYRAQTDPDVIVYIQPDHKRPTIMLLIIENIGSGVAHDIEFSLPSDFPKNAFGVSSTGKSEFEPMIDGPLVNGVSSLPPKGRRTITWGQAGGLFDYMQGSPKDIRVSFKRKGGPYLYEERFSTVSTLEIDSFIQTDASKTSIEAHLKDISETLKKIERNLGKKL